MHEIKRQWSVEITTVVILGDLNVDLVDNQYLYLWYVKSTSQNNSYYEWYGCDCILMDLKSVSKQGNHIIRRFQKSRNSVHQSSSAKHSDNSDHKIVICLDDSPVISNGPSVVETGIANITVVRTSQ